jgi:hypothetical protein
MNVIVVVVVQFSFDCFNSHLFSARISMFSLEVKVQAFMTKDSAGKKIYCKGKDVNFSWEVGTISYDLLHSSLASVVSWSSDQNATIWFFDKTVGEDVMLVDEVQFQKLFEMYESEMHCQLLLVVVNENVWEEHEFDYLEPLCVIPPDPEMQTETPMQPDPANAN